MFNENNVILETIESTGLETAGSINVQGGTNRHESGRDGDTMGGMARTFIKFDTVNGDSDIRIVFWDQTGTRHDFENIQAISVAVGGGEESRTMAAGIITVAQLFEELGIEQSEGRKFRASIAQGEGERIVTA